MNLILFFSLLIAASTVEADSAWGYSGDMGPANWKDSTPACGGDAQSPIYIVEADAVNKENSFSDFDAGAATDGVPTAKNNGHSVKVANFRKTFTFKLEGQTFQLDSFHFHWGKGGKGSEHLLNGKAFDGELHLVHYNTKYADLTKAVSQSDGLAVIGIFLETSDDAPSSFVTCMETLAEKDSKATCLGDEFNPYDLLPKDGLYFSYKGSLTTPPCSESVAWNVFKTPLKVTSKLLDKFRELKVASGTLENNYRPPQELNGREVSKSTHQI